MAIHTVRSMPIVESSGIVLSMRLDAYGRTIVQAFLLEQLLAFDRVHRHIHDVNLVALYHGTARHGTT